LCCSGLRKRSRQIEGRGYLKSKGRDDQKSNAAEGEKWCIAIRSLSNHPTPGEEKISMHTVQKKDAFYHVGKGLKAEVD